MPHPERVAHFTRALASLRATLPDYIRNISITWLDDRNNILAATTYGPEASPHSAFPAPGTFTRCLNGCCVAYGRNEGDILSIHADEDTLASPEEAKLLLYAFDRELARLEHCAVLQEHIDFGKKIVHSMASGFLVLLPDLTVQDANPAACALLQTSEETLIGSRLSDIVLSDLKVKSIFKTGKPITDRELFIKLKNKVLHILKTAVPVFDQDGEVIAVLDHFREIKESHRLVSRMTGAKASFTFDDIIYAGQSMSTVIDLGRVAAGSSLSVLISGESGTGKELFAHAIHMASERANAPFVVIDCASMPRELVASELFGYMDGAFTGARKGGMPGKFELADGGTVFLDELGELPLEVQAQFLRVLQTRQVTRLSGKTVLPVDVRIIAATNRDLDQEVELGNFREDLFYRLNVLGIHIPPLRSRPEDIFPLASYFADKYCDMIGKSRIRFSAQAMEALRSYTWPGNVRELENVVARAVHICTGYVDVEHITPPRRTTVRDRPYTTAKSGESFKELEARALKDALDACGGNISETARILGVARSTVYKKLAACKRRGLLTDVL